VVSTANVAQLAVDLMIATLSLVRVAVLDPRYCVPVVGAREDGLNGITTPIECEHLHCNLEFVNDFYVNFNIAKSIWSLRP
jgi:proteasome assembly chaperone 2